jgi:hypothetical protein
MLAQSDFFESWGAVSHGIPDTRFLDFAQKLHCAPAPSCTPAPVRRWGWTRSAGRRPQGQLLSFLSLEAGVGPGRARHGRVTHPGPLGGGQAGRLSPAGALPAGVCTCLSWALSALPGQRTAGWVPAGHPGTGARKSGPHRAAEAARHVYRVGVWDRARLAGDNGQRGTPRPRSCDHRADRGRVLRRRDAMSQNAEYARGNHASRPWHRHPRRGRGGGLRCRPDAVVTFPANTLVSALPHNGRCVGVRSSDDASRWPACRTHAARRWRGGSPQRASFIPVHIGGRHATVSEASPCSEQGDGAEAQ